MSYTVPGVQISQEYALQPASLARPLPGCIVAHHFRLARFGAAGEKAGISLGAYDRLADTCYAWPGRPAGAVVDAGYTRVYVDRARLRYFHDAVGSDAEITATARNKIRSDDVVWMGGNGFDRLAALLRDVRVGDGIRLVGDDCGTPATFDSTVVGFEADAIAASVGAAAADVDNDEAFSADTDDSQIAGDENNVSAASDGAAYAGLPDGYPSETYFIEVLVGGGSGTAILRVTTASGEDEVASLPFTDDFGDDIDIGDRGLKVAFNLGAPTAGPDDVFIAGQKFQVVVSQAWTPPTPGASGSYAGAQDTTYLIEVSRGGLFAGVVKPQIRVTTTNGIDLSGPTTVAASATYVAVGTKGVLIRFTGAGLNKGDRYSIPVTAEADGGIRTLVLADDIPAGFQGDCGDDDTGSSIVAAPDLDVSLFIVKDGLELTRIAPDAYPIENWEQSATEICLNSGATALDDSWVDGGDPQPLELFDGALYAHYRARLSTWVGILGSLSDAELVADTLGPVHPDNPLAFGVYYALLNSSGEDVGFTAVGGAGDDLTAWSAALRVLLGRRDVYTLVPCTYSKAVHDLFEAHVKAESSKTRNRWRTARFCRLAEQTIGIYTASAADLEEPPLATITDDPDTSGTQYTLVTAAGETFITAGVRAGDVVRALYTTDDFGEPVYSSFVVDAVLTEQSLRLLAGPAAAVNIAAKIEVWRTMTKDELALALAGYPGQYASSRVMLDWPDVAEGGGLSFPGYFLSCAYAGLRSGSLPHQGLTNLELVGFDGMSRSDFFTDDQLNRMAENGYWITVKDRRAGAIFARHQLTTGDQSNVLLREASLISNPDSICHRFRDEFEGLIGKGNAGPHMLPILRSALTSLIEEYKNTVLIERLGPQLIEATISKLQVGLLKDHIEGRVDGVFPAPFNVFDLILGIS